MTLGQYLQGKMRSNVVKIAILATILRLYAANSKSFRLIFSISFTLRHYTIEQKPFKTLSNIGLEVDLTP